MVDEEAGTGDPAPLGRALDGRYRLEAEIGTGGLGSVYRATHEQLAKSVAVKLLHHGGTSDLLRGRFEREARALAALNHPNIVAVSDYGISEGTPYLVMELLEGETLAERLERGLLGSLEIQKLVGELVEALRFVHAHGLVHRDLKPSNVFLQRLALGGERVKLLDFGLAKFLVVEGVSDPTLTRDGAVVGTPAYMSPEQASGDTTDVRSDVYALGIILFQLLTGRLPFQGDSVEQLRSHLIATVPKLNEVQGRRAVRPELDALLARALGKRREERFADAGEMLQALEAIPEPWLVEADSSAPGAATGPGPALGARAEAGSARPEIEQAAGQPRRARRPARGLLLFGGGALVVGLGVALAAGWLGGRSRGAEHPSVRQPSTAREPASGMPPIAAPAAPEAPALPISQAVAVEQAVAELAAGLAPVLQAAADSEASLEQQLHDPSEALRDSAELPKPLVAPSPNQPRAKNPWLRGALPRELRSLRATIHAGSRGSERMVVGLRRYNREHATDPRGNLLLAKLYLNREWRADAVNQLSLAYQRDPSSRGAPEMLPMLLSCVVQGAAAQEASRLIEVAYGREASAEIERALQANRDDLRVTARLTALRDRVRGA